MIRRTSLNLDFDLVEEAKRELGTTATTETIHRALEETVRQARLRRLAAWHPEMSNEEIEAASLPELEDDAVAERAAR